jgi:hypothetical protein
MGPEWFERVMSPATRLKALYELRIHGPSEEQAPEPFEEFSADISYSAVFPSPQPGHPEAHLILSGWNWARRDSLLNGPDPDQYPILPIEAERWKEWQALDVRKSPGFRSWQPGAPLLESFSLALVDSKGKELSGGLFAGVGALADFNGDGMEDVFEIKRVSAWEKGGPEVVFDCISIGPLISEKPRFAQLYCNRRSTDGEAKRDWLFTVRNVKGLPALVLVSAEPGNQREMTFRFEEDQLRLDDVELPEDIWIDQDPAGEFWHAASSFLNARGFSDLGFGSDSAEELQAGRPKPVDHFALNRAKSKLPAIAELGDGAPRMEALAIARSFYEESYPALFEWQNTKPRFPTSEEAWLELEIHHGWAPDETQVWWLRDGTAELWISSPQTSPQNEELASTEFSVTTLSSAANLARAITVLHELDDLRRIPTTPFAPEIKHSRNFGDDLTSYEIRSKTALPSPRISRFPRSTPELWSRPGTIYDRKVAGVLASTLVLKLPKGEATENKQVRDLAAQWLAPENVAKVPPALARTAIQACGENRWPETDSVLAKLKNFLGPVSEKEKRLADVRRDVMLNSRGTGDYDARERLKRRLLREEWSLLDDLSGDPRHELRETLELALKRKAAKGGD